MRQVFAIVACALAASVLGGCSALVPGLNVSAPREGTYNAIDDRTAKTSGQAADDIKYQVIEITPVIVGQLVAQQAGSREDGGERLAALDPLEDPLEYHVGPADIVFVTVWEHPELTVPDSGVLRSAADEGRLVGADGTMYFPYVGTFTAAGMSARELREFIAEHLRKTIVDPKVDVRVVAYRSDRVQVTGEVRTPGVVTLDDTPKGVLQAIDASGGLTAEASHRRAYLLRNGKSYPVDLAGLLSGERPARNPRLEAGDEIRVPTAAADKVYVLGEVERQRPVILRQHAMPLIEALAEAGGLDKLRANDSGVLVFRRNARDSATVATIYALDMASPGGMLLASEFPLAPRDVVYVKATAFAQYDSVIQRILPTIHGVYEIDQITR